MSKIKVLADFPSSIVAKSCRPDPVPYKMVIVNFSLSHQYFSSAANFSKSRQAFAGGSPDSPLVAVAA
jgi:hypothetical protein